MEPQVETRQDLIKLMQPLLMEANVLLVAIAKSWKTDPDPRAATQPALRDALAAIDRALLGCEKFAVENSDTAISDIDTRLARDSGEVRLLMKYYTLLRDRQGSCLPDKTERLAIDFSNWLEVLLSSIGKKLEYDCNAYRQDLTGNL
jgi:hypothetical protein